jgi:hypothetical protein
MASGSQGRTSQDFDLVRCPASMLALTLRARAQLMKSVQKSELFFDSFFDISQLLPRVFSVGERSPSPVVSASPSFLGD